MAIHISTTDSEAQAVYIADVNVSWPEFYPSKVRLPTKVAAFEYSLDRAALRSSGVVSDWLSTVLDKQTSHRWMPAYACWVQRRPLNEIHKRRGFWALNGSEFSSAGRVNEALVQSEETLIFGAVQFIGSIEELAKEIVKARQSVHGLFLLGATAALAEDFLAAQLDSPNVTRADYFVRHYVPEATIIAEEQNCLVIRVWREDKSSVDILGPQALVKQLADVAC